MIRGGRSGWSRLVSDVRAGPLRRFVLLVLACGLASGCYVVSLSPIYGEDTIDFDGNLVGRWSSDEDGVSVEIGRSEWRGYAIVWHDRDGAQTLRGRLTRIGVQRVMDVTLPPGQDRGPFLLPVHVFVRVALDGDTLSVQELDYDRLTSPEGRALLPAGTARDERERLVLAASTKDLRAWMARTAGRSIFGAGIVLRRTAADAAVPPGAGDDD